MLICSNVVVSLVKDLIPDKVRIPAFIVIIASFVTIVELVMQAYLPALFEQLGLFIPLIVVNCIVLGRAEAFASKNRVGASAIDGLGMGLGFSFALTLLGGVRELLGSGAFFNFKFMENAIKNLQFNAFFGSKRVPITNCVDQSPTVSSMSTSCVMASTVSVVGS